MPRFTLRLLLNGARHTYPSSGLCMDIEGTLVSAPAPLGWRVVQDGLTVDLCAEPLIGSAHGAFGRQAAGAAESFGRGGPYPHVDFNARY